MKLAIKTVLTLTLIAVTTLSAGVITVTPSPSLALTEGTVFNGVLGTFTDNDGDALSHYSVNINWGDGSQLSQAIVTVGTGGVLQVSGSHTYDEGSYVATFSITDSDASSATGVGSATVSDAPLTLISSPALISFTPGAALSNLVLAHFSDGNPSALLSDFTRTINWGDGSPTTPGTIVAGASDFSLLGSHTYTTGGPFVITTSVLDDGGASVRTIATAAVNTPEPASLTLIMIGLGSAVLLARRRAHKS